MMLTSRNELINIILTNFHVFFIRVFRPNVAVNSLLN